MSKKVSTSDSKIDGPKAKGTFLQRMAETFGNRRRTEMNENFYQLLDQIEQHRICVESLYDGLQHIIQPDAAQLAAGNIISHSTHYDNYIKALVKAKSESMSDPAETRKFIAIVSYTYGQLMVQTKKYQEAASPQMSTLLRYKKEYVEEVKRNQEELERRRVPMDAAKHRVEKTHDMEKLKVAGEDYQALIKEFEDASNKLHAVMEQLPQKKEHHRRAIRKIMEAEQKYHLEAANILREGLDRCIKALGTGQPVGTPSSMTHTEKTKSEREL